jgi:hypothetical protein
MGGEGTRGVAKTLLIEQARSHRGPPSRAGFIEVKPASPLIRTSYLSCVGFSVLSL